MVLHFNVTKDKRKAMVQAIEKEIGGKAKYLGVPSCAYQIGSFTEGKNGELEFGDFDDIDEVAPIIDACVDRPKPIHHLVREIHGPFRWQTPSPSGQPVGSSADRPPRDTPPPSPEG